MRCEAMLQSLAPFFVLVGLMQSSLVYREKRLNKDLNDKYGMLFSRLNIPILSNRSLNAFRDIVLSFNNNFFPFPVLDIKIQLHYEKKVTRTTNWNC